MKKGNRGERRMTVIERIYDNEWFVSNATPTARAQLAAAVDWAQLDWESAADAATRARGVSSAAFAVALAQTNVAQAALDRAKANATAAARCTHIANGHAFSVVTTVESGARRLEVSSCTLRRSARLALTGQGENWTAVLSDPHARTRDDAHVTLDTDPWDSLHRIFHWITTGEL